MPENFLRKMVLIACLFLAMPVSAAESGAAAAGEAGAPVETPALKTLEKFTGRNGLGFVVGAGTGIGLSYRRYLSDRFALRGAGYILLIRPAGLALYDASLLGQFDFRRDSKFVLYAVGGVAFGTAVFAAGDVGGGTSGVFPSIGGGIELGNHDKPGMTYQLELALTGIFVEGQFKTALPLPQVGIHYIF